MNGRADRAGSLMGWAGEGSGFQSGGSGFQPALVQSVADSALIGILSFSSMSRSRPAGLPSVVR